MKKFIALSSMAAVASGLKIQTTIEDITDKPQEATHEKIVLGSELSAEQQHMIPATELKSKFIIDPNNPESVPRPAPTEEPQNGKLVVSETDDVAPPSKKRARMSSPDLMPFKQLMNQMMGGNGFGGVDDIFGDEFDIPSFLGGDMDYDAFDGMDMGMPGAVAQQQHFVSSTRMGEDGNVISEQHTSNMQRDATGHVAEEADDFQAQSKDGTIVDASAHSHRQGTKNDYVYNGKIEDGKPVEHHTASNAELENIHAKVAKFGNDVNEMATTRKFLAKRDERALTDATNLVV